MPDTFCRAFRNAGAAVRAFEPIYAGQVSLDRYRLHGTGAGANAAADASDRADFLYIGTAPLRIAGNLHARCFWREFQNRFRADGGACAAARALVGVYFWKAACH